MRLHEIGAYWDTRADGYSISIHEQLAGVTSKHYRELFQMVLPENAQLNCLDVGCGPGFFSILLNEMQYRVTSMDYSTEMLDRATKNLQEFSYEPHMQQGDAQNLPWEDESFDVVVSRDLVWNLEHPERAYQEWLRVLKPGGTLIVADGNHYLYYYDKDYAAAHQEKQKGKEAHPCYGVDPTPINEIARDLPLSRCLRPEWDVEMLTKLGLHDIRTELSTRPFTNPETGESRDLVFHFELWGHK